MWQVLLLAAANKEFCDKVTNFEPVRVCGAYNFQNTFDADNCREVLKSYSAVDIEESNWDQVKYSENGNTFSGCRAECPDQTEKGCFEIMKKFTNNYDASKRFMMGFTSINDGKRDLAFFEQWPGDGCEPVLYTKEMLKAACEQGFRSHHGIVPAATGARIRRSEPEKYNNLFEKEEDEESHTRAIVGGIIGGLAGVVLLGYGLARCRKN